VDLAVPGLSAALTRAGSLAGAVGQLRPTTPRREVRAGRGCEAG
jgi:hypothetical protein